MAAALVAAMGLGGCAVVAGAIQADASAKAGSGKAGPSTPAPKATATPAEPSASADPSGLDWTACSDVAKGAECATVKAPLDWSKPDGDQIDIAVARIPARDPDNRVGSLLLNPGGPGGSGVSFLGSAAGLVGRDVRDAFDLVGFDPRGVGRSSAVTCYTETAKLDEFWAATWPMTPEGYEASAKIVEPFAQACADNTGPLLGHVDTDSSARDMDLLREVLGDSQLYYLGYSYGTQLGAAYAELFPDKVGRMVLDGAVDPSLPSSEHEVVQAKGFQQALEAYVDDCLQGDVCPLTGPKQAALDQIHDLLVSIQAKPLPTGETRQLTVPLALNGLLVTMYEDSAWFMLTQALGEALKGNGSTLLFLSDAYLERGPNGYENNQMEAFIAIGCLDGRDPADLASVEAHAKALKQAAPTFGEFWGYAEKLCELWPYPQVGSPHKVSAPGAAPIVVIGTTGDPATPYEWAVSLAGQLQGSSLVTYEGNGHTAYGRSNSCVTKAIGAYLVNGEIPENGLTC
jgi:pimeloyl-ACP methyl ester carboxylesterase